MTHPEIKVLWVSHVYKDNETQINAEERRLINKSAFFCVQINFWAIMFSMDSYRCHTCEINLDGFEYQPST